MSGSPITAYSENGITKYYYTGTNALREYKSYIPSIANTIVGVPIEDNGGMLTQMYIQKKEMKNYIVK